MATYTLTDGTRKTQLTISGDTTVVFPTKLDYFGVRSLDGANILVSKIKAPTVLEDGVYSTDEGDGDVVVDDGVFTDTLYLKGSGTVVVYGGAKSNHLPFKVGGKGGDDGGTLRMLGATTTPLSDGATTNPITIDGQSVTVEKNDVAIYNTREFYFSGTTWSEFGGQMDTVPTQGSANAVTSDGIYKVTPLSRGTGNNSAVGGTLATATSQNTFAFGYNVSATANQAVAFGNGTQANQAVLFACGKYNSAQSGDLFNIGNGSAPGSRSNILEVNSTEMNVNGDIKCHNLVVPVGGYEETALWTGDQSSAPSEIEISEAYTNFDALFFKTRTTTTTSEDYISAYILASAYGIGEFFQIFGYADSGYRYVWYKFTDATHLERGTIGDLYMRKIVGIKYPKLYVPPVSLNQSPATLLTNQTEELTDGNR